MPYGKNHSYSQQMLPNKVNYFKEEAISEIVTIPNRKPNIDKIIDNLVFPEVEHIRLIETEEGKSNEGQNLTGYKLDVQLVLKQKLTYVSTEPKSPVYVAYYESLKGMFVILPGKIKNKSISEYVKSGRLTVFPYIEAIYARKLDIRNIHKSILLFLDVKILD